MFPMMAVSMLLIMGHAGHQPAKGLHLLRLAEFVLELFVTRDVLFYGEEVRDFLSNKKEYCKWVVRIFGMLKERFEVEF